MSRILLRQRQSCWLRFAYGLRSAEIAMLLNKSEGAVRAMLSRALKLLRTVYEHEEEE